MPSTAPALTWQMTNLRTVVDPFAVQDVIDAIALAIGDSTTWEVKTTAAGMLEIGPVGGATPNTRLIIAAGINAAQRQVPHNGLAVDANELWIGIAPEGGTVGITGGWGPATATDPYTTRWSLFWRFSPTINTNQINQVFCLTSDEVFSCWMYKGTTADDWWGAGGGAIIDPPTDADGEGTPGRVHGTFVSGRDIISSTFWQNLSDFLNSGTGNIDPVVGCFRPALTTRWTILDRATPSGLARPRCTTEIGTSMATPVLMYQAAVTTTGSSGGVNPTNAMGVLRQIRKTEDGIMRGAIMDSAGAIQSYIVSGSSFSLLDAASFDNG
jgi:hypothetical protein